MNLIKSVEKISLLSKFLVVAGFKLPSVQTVRLAIELALSLDELSYFGITIQDLENFSTLHLPEHWKQRTEFLKIALGYWSSDPSLYQPRTSSVNSTLKQSFKIVEAENFFEEANFIKEIIRKNPNKTACIFCPDDLLSFIQIIFQLDLSYDHLELQRFFKIESLNELKHLAQILTLELTDLKTEKLTITKKIQTLIKTNAELVFFPGLNEGFWNCQNYSSYWIHKDLREFVKLSSLSSVDSFKELLNQISSKEIFLSYSKKIQGANVRKHKVLINLIRDTKSKIEIYHSAASANINERRGSETTLITFPLPEKITAREVEILAEDKYDFFIKKILNLSPTFYDKTIKELRELSFDLLENFLLDEKEKLKHSLARIADLNFYHFQHCQNILRYLEKYYAFLKNPENFEKTYEYELLLNSGETVTLSSSHILLYHKELFVFKVFEQNPRLEEILHGGACGALVKTWLLWKLQGPEGIEKITTLSLRGIDPYPVEINSLEISQSTIEFFEQRLQKIFENRIIAPTNKEERFQHFKRQQ